MGNDSGRLRQATANGLTTSAYSDSFLTALRFELGWEEFRSRIDHSDDRDLSGRAEEDSPRVFISRHVRSPNKKTVDGVVERKLHGEDLKSRPARTQAESTR